MQLTKEEPQNQGRQELARPVRVNARVRLRPEDKGNETLVT